MATKPFKWRTTTSGAVYVDSMCGSDIYGNGTQANPYQSLGKAWRGHTTYHPSVIICRGSFCEDMSDGSHSTTIQGDSYGAAIFDGNGSFTCYGFTTPSMMFINCPAVTYGSASSSANTLLVGVGRAGTSAGVGVASVVCGSAASLVCVRASGLYMGGIGGNTAAQQNVICSPQCNSAYKLYYTIQGNNNTCKGFSVYDVPKSLRQEQRNTGQHGSLIAWVMGKCAIFCNECLTFNNCFFTSDCEFYDKDTLLEVQGETSEERQAWLNDYIATKGYTDTVKTVFEDCVFSNKTSYDVFNDPDNGDLSLRYENADEELLPYSNNYRGALEPAIRIPVKSDSSQTPATWDERTASGLVAVQDDKIVLDDSVDAHVGEITSKVLVTNPDKIAISGLFAQYESKYQEYGIRAGDKFPEGDKYPLGSTLPEGRYVVRGGSLLCDDVYIAEGNIIVVDSNGATITASSEESDSQAYASEILDCNVNDYLLLRTCPTAYAIIKSSEGLQKGGTYLNIYDKEIQYRGRTIVHNESFVAENDDDTFTCDDADYKIAVIFDDSRVPSQPWIPAQMWGEYFAGRVGGSYQQDADGNYLGSGNYLAWQTTANGGYSNTLVKSRAQARYVQLRLMVKSNSSE
jgi:hypothetical protein